MTKLEQRISALEKEAARSIGFLIDRLSALEARISGCVCEQMGEPVRGQYWCPLHGMRHPPASYPYDMAPAPPAESRCAYKRYPTSETCGYRIGAHQMNGGPSVVCGHPFTPAPTEPPAREERTHLYLEIEPPRGGLWPRLVECRRLNKTLCPHIHVTVAEVPPPPAASEAGEEPTLAWTCRNCDWANHSAKIRCDKCKCDRPEAFAPSPSAKPKEASETSRPAREARRWTLDLMDGPESTARVRVIELTPETEAALEWFTHECPTAEVKRLRETVARVEKLAEAWGLSSKSMIATAGLGDQIRRALRDEEEK